MMSKDLEVRHCRVLLAVKDHGGVAAAARALGLAQSTVSETLLSLERVLGAPVTRRRPGGGTALTPAATSFLPHAQALIAASEAALVAFTARDQGIVRLGTVESISSFLLPEPLSAFRARRPGVDVRITIGLCRDLRNRVRRGELDAALTIEGAEDARNDGGGSRILAPAQLQVVVAPGNALAQRTVERSQLAARRLVLADPDGAFNELLHAWFRDPAQRPKFESAGSIDGVKRGVLKSDAIGVLPAYAVAQEIAAGALIALQLDEPLPTIALLLMTREPPAYASAVGDLVEQIGAAINRS